MFWLKLTRVEVHAYKKNNKSDSVEVPFCQMAVKSFSLWTSVLKLGIKAVTILVLEPEMTIFG